MTRTAARSRSVSTPAIPHSVRIISSSCKQLCPTVIPSNTKPPGAAIPNAVEEMACRVNFSSQAELSRFASGVVFRPKPSRRARDPLCLARKGLR